MPSSVLFNCSFVRRQSNEKVEMNELHRDMLIKLCMHFNFRCKPALGKIFSSACHSRLFLKKVPESRASKSAKQVPIIRDSKSGEVPSLTGEMEQPVCEMTVRRSDISSPGKNCCLKLTPRGFEKLSKTN